MLQVDPISSAPRLNRALQIVNSPLEVGFPLMQDIHLFLNRFALPVRSVHTGTNACHCDKKGEEGTTPIMRITQISTGNKSEKSTYCQTKATATVSTRSVLFPFQLLYTRIEFVFEKW